MGEGAKEVDSDARVRGGGGDIMRLEDGEEDETSFEVAVTFLLSDGIAICAIVHGV